MGKALRLYPAFKDYVWGGKRLMEKYEDVRLPRIAEAWVASAHKDGESISEDGRTLSEILKPVEKTETPILIKLIDAKNNLSVQVHPDDDYAYKNENSPGKTEMWYILDADEGAGIYYGFKNEITKEDLLKSIENEALTELLRFVPVKKGQSYFIPAGTVHAIGAGLLIAEIQQCSNITYRVYDYGRVDDKGLPRPLHIEKALEVASLCPISIDGIEKTGNLLADCEYFKAEKLSVCREYAITKKDVSSYILITKGAGVVDKTDARVFDCFYIPPNHTPSISGNFEAILVETKKLKEV
jgi:mannose-6-phosphate isomerase